MLASALTAPTIKPASGPNAMPESMIMAKIALKCGSGITTRAATASAESPAITTSSRACGFRLSNASRNGTISSAITSVLVI